MAAPRALLVAALLALTGLGASRVACAAEFVDAVTADVDGTIVSVSDVALAQALGVFGFSASPPTSLDAGDVDRVIEARLLVAEAQRLDIAPTSEEVEAVWQESARRFGGVERLLAWLDAHAVARAWARRLVTEEAQRRRFVDVRFRAFAFATPDEIAAAMPAGAHDAAEEARVRARLEEAQTERLLREWIEEQTARASIRRVLPPGQRLSSPLALP